MVGIVSFLFVIPYIIPNVSSYAWTIVNFRWGPHRFCFCLSGVKDGLSGSTEFTVPIFNTFSSTSQPASLAPTLHPTSETSVSLTSHLHTQASSGSTISTSYAPFSSPPSVTPLSSFSPTDLPAPPSCNISPTVGDVLSPFYVTCSVDPTFCTTPSCTYSFSTSTGMFISRPLYIFIFIIKVRLLLSVYKKVFLMFILFKAFRNCKCLRINQQSNKKLHSYLLCSMNNLQFKNLK